MTRHLDWGIGRMDHASVASNIPFFGMMMSWILLLCSTFIKTERDDIEDTHYRFSLSVFLFTGGLAGAVIYGLSFALSGLSFFYISSIALIFLIQAVIDAHYKEIALEWVAVALLIHIGYIWFSGGASLSLLLFVVGIGLGLGLCSLFLPFGLGDSLVLTVNSILFFPLHSTHWVGALWAVQMFLIVLCLAQCVILLYAGFRYVKDKRTKVNRVDKRIPFIPAYTVALYGWLLWYLWM